MKKTKIYIAVAVVAAPGNWGKVKEYYARCREFAKELAIARFEVVSNKDVEVSTTTIRDTDSLVSEADAVVCLADEPSDGFGNMVTEAMTKHRKPAFLFIPQDECGHDVPDRWKSPGGQWQAFVYPHFDILVAILEAHIVWRPILAEKGLTTVLV